MKTAGEIELIKIYKYLVSFLYIPTSGILKIIKKTKQNGKLNISVIYEVALRASKQEEIKTAKVTYSLFIKT